MSTVADLIYQNLKIDKKEYTCSYFYCKSVYVFLYHPPLNRNFDVKYY